MEIYCGNIKEYKKYIKGENAKCPYIDPDTTRDKGSLFYKNLTEFLLHQKMKMNKELNSEIWTFDFVEKKSEDYNYFTTPDSIRFINKDNCKEKVFSYGLINLGFLLPRGIEKKVKAGRIDTHMQNI